MCAIVDANVRDEVFGDNPTEAGKFFREWLSKPNGGILVVGGTKLRKELGNNKKFTEFLRDRIRAGRARKIDDQDVAIEEEKLRARRVCRSGDVHILALARKSYTRLLFTNDQALQDDFKNNDIIHNPPGQIYTTAFHRDVQKDHRDRLTSRNIKGRKGICRHCRRQK